MGYSPWGLEKPDKTERLTLSQAWQSPDIHQVRIPWSDFFDLPSLNRNIPVIEYEQFIAGEAGGGPLTGAGRLLVLV